MFLRFTILSPDPDTGKNTGILVAAHKLRDEGNLSVDEHRELRLCLQWFNDHLTVPKTYNLQNKRALAWFKPEAQKPIERMWQLKHILDTQGLHVNVLKTATPGRIVFEDGWQVIAIPAKGQVFS